MTELYLIRHGKTYGNTLGRYIGTTDESLCTEGRALLNEYREAGCYPEQVDAVYVSPLKRCVETAALIWPSREVIAKEKLRECDFGEFENRNYQELSGNPKYQEWVDSNGTLPFPGGESREAFQNRCLTGFAEVLADIRERRIKRAALVVHGGTIMSILEKYGPAGETFYRWQAKNGDGYACLWDETGEAVRLSEIRRILL